MKKRKKERRNYTIQALRRVVLFGFIVPILVMQLLQNYFALESFVREVEQGGKSTIYLYQNQLETSMARIEKTVASYWAQDYSHGRMLYTQSDLDALGYTYTIISQYKTLMQGESTLAAMFLLSQPNDLIRSTYDQNNTTYEERQDMQAYAAKVLDGGEQEIQKGWQPCPMGDRYFLVRVMGSEKACTICFLNLEDTVKPQDAPYYSDGALLLYADKEGKAITSSQWVQEQSISLLPLESSFSISGSPLYLVVKTWSEKSGMYVVFLEEYPGGLQNMGWILFMTLVFSVIVMALIPVLFTRVKSLYIRPLEEMTGVLQAIRDGDLSRRFPVGQRVKELKQVCVSFNQMMDEMKGLKIQAYETELQRRYAELQYLQLQISPHFFLNFLKSLYAMAQRKRFDRIQQAILLFSDYVRYMFYDNTKTVPLDTELHHVENYLDLQRYMTAGDICCSMQVDDEVRHALVPVLCVQTFIENSCKYAMVPGKELVIELRVMWLQSEEGDKVAISVSDNGPGLPSDVYEECMKDLVFEKKENHVGIRNIRQRLHLLYGDKAGFICINHETGCQFEIILPLQKPGDGTKEKEGETL